MRGHHSPSEGGPTSIKVITHRRGDYHVDGCSGGECRIDDGLNGSLRMSSFGICSRLKRTLIASKFAKLVAWYDLTTSTKE